jgi:hypothetical protein
MARKGFHGTRPRPNLNHLCAFVTGRWNDEPWLRRRSSILYWPMVIG